MLKLIISIMGDNILIYYPLSERFLVK